jgi:large subunit ribosomal protein L17
MLRNLASSLFLTEREVDEELDPNPPATKGRVITTLQKAKEVRPLVEKCVTIARRSLAAEEAAGQYDTAAERGSEEWRRWRQSDQWQKWNEAIAPAVAARRRVLQLIGDKQATRVLFEEIAPRFADREGGYTRILRLGEPRLGDAGTRAILEFVGTHDRVKQTSSVKPEFAPPEEPEESEEDRSPPAAEDMEAPAGGEAEEPGDEAADATGDQRS